MSRINNLTELNELISRGGSRIKGNPLSPAPHQPVAEPPKKRSKYGNQKTPIDGILFDSKREADRYLVLKLMKAGGEIRELDLQVEFELLREPVKIKYIADFCYQERRRRAPGQFFWQYVVEDAKGMRTREYKRKRKMMKAVFGIIIRES